MMVHKSSIVPGLSRFIDENILSNYAPTSMKRILMAGAVSLFLKQNESAVDTITSNPLFTGLGVVNDRGLIDIDAITSTLKNEVNKVGFMRVSIPLVGDIDFTSDDLDALNRFIVEANTQGSQPLTAFPQATVQPHSMTTNTGVY
jgi:hypothetical protein